MSAVNLLDLLPPDATPEQRARAADPIATALRALAHAKTDEKIEGWLSNEPGVRFAASSAASVEVVARLACYIQRGTLPGSHEPVDSDSDEPVHVACNEARRRAHEEMLAIVAQHAGKVASWSGT